jgi:hypothetical protein
MFPERAGDQHRRPLLTLAITFSLLMHLAGAGVWLYFNRELAPLVAKFLPRPSPTPEIVALSDAITIEKRTVPRQSRRSQPHPATRRAVSRPQPQRVAQLPAPPAPPIPTLAPLPTTEPTRAPTREPTTAPTAEPTYRPLRGNVHHPRAAPTPEPQRAPPVTPPQTQVVKQQPSSRNAFSPQQIAALDAQFQRTIDASRRSLTDVPPQRRPPARNPQQRRYEAIMAGTPEMFFAAAQGDCIDLEDTVTRGPVHVYYIRCTIRYPDDYFENVSYPWPYKFPASADPFQQPPGALIFHGQGPPPGFVLPPNFALSRAICSFYRAQCERLIERERAAGNQPAPGG